MRAYCITLDTEYSEASAQRCRATAEAVGVTVTRFTATPKEDAREVMEYHGLRWRWAKGNTAPHVCHESGLKQHVYKTQDLRARIGCAMSHYRLWRLCLTRAEPIVVLEHDTVFIRPLPELKHSNGITMLNDPTGATPRGEWWAAQIKAKGEGVHEKTVVFEDGRPDGLAGNSAYVITPAAAQAAVEMYHWLGVWPNDATLCRQLIPGLREVYPFVTRVQQTKSTSGGY